MDREKALKVLLANAYCYTDGLSCTGCPFAPQDGVINSKDCHQFGRDMLIEAVNVLSNQGTIS